MKTIQVLLLLSLVLYISTHGYTDFPKAR